MSINIIVKDPEMIRRLDEIDDILSGISTYEQETGKKNNVGVLMIQNRQLGAIYIIETRKNAEKEINKHVFDDRKGNRTCEWGIKFYPRSYFKNLRKKLNGTKQTKYQEYSLT